MQLSRRAFTGGALCFAIGTQYDGRALAQARPDLAAAIAAIAAYAEAHRRFFSLPGLTLGLTLPDGFTKVLDFGFANRDARTAIGADTLFQIGSISKSMTALVIHQMAAEGKLGLDARVSDLLPEVPLPRGNMITVQHLLDHVAGLPDSAPIFPRGGLWTAYAPGAHWHYSNTGYDILGKVAEHVGGKPLSLLLDERIFRPLGMARSRGAIVAADRTLYAQGYEAADQSAVYARGVPLAPAAWVDVTFGAGSVASTADDMTRFLRWLAASVQDRGGLGLSSQQAQQFVSHAVQSDTPGMRYGNGLMHVGAGGRTYFHHTGGMVSFSSSFHLDKTSGVGAFASANLSAFAEYRPRVLTRFAVDTLTNAMAGRALPSPPPLEVPLGNPASYVGHYAGPDGAFDIRSGGPLVLVTGEGEAPLQYWGGEIFRTTHPRFHRFSLMFERSRGVVTGASWGPSSFGKQGAPATAIPRPDLELAKFTGRYVDDNPWYGSATVVQRAGRLWVGTETPLVRTGSGYWRVGEESWSPERAMFADFIDGRPQTLLFSGEKFQIVSQSD